MMLTTLCLLSAVFVTPASTFHCRNGAGEREDWWIAKSHPRSVEASSYGYMLSSDKTKWMNSNEEIESDRSPLHQTTNQRYVDFAFTPDQMFILYNDQVERGEDNLGKPDLAHHGQTKGVILYDATKKSGLWLLHSVPGFPLPEKLDFFFRSEFRTKGQLYFCMTLDEALFNSLIPFWLIASVNAYEHWIGMDIVYGIPDVNNITYGDFSVGCSARKQRHPFKIGDSDFVVFGKQESEADYMYQTAIAPYFQSGLQVQSSLVDTSKGYLSVQQEGCAGRYPVHNVLKTEFPIGPNGTRIEVLHTQEEAKWAVTVTGEKWFCAGDLDRTRSQKTQAGGAVCIKNGKLHELFAEGIKETSESTCA